MTTEHSASKGFLKWVNTEAGTLAFRVATLILLGLLAILGWQAKNMGYNFIAGAPAVTGLATLAQTAEQNADAAKQAASAANLKIDQVLSNQADLTKSLSEVGIEMREVHTVQRNVVTSLAAITQHLDDVSKQVDKIEARQDAVPAR